MKYNHFSYIFAMSKMSDKNHHRFHNYKFIKKMKLKAGISEILIKKVSKIGIDCKKSPFTIRNWIYESPHLLEKWALKSIKKHTGLTKDQIFEQDE